VGDVRSSCKQCSPESARIRLVRLLPDLGEYETRVYDWDSGNVDRSRRAFGALCERKPRAICRDAGAAMTFLLPNGFDPTLHFPRDKDRSRSLLGLPICRHILCYAGNLLPRSGVLELVQAVGRLKERGVSTLFIVLGQGPWGERVLRLASQLGLVDSVLLKQVHYNDVLLFLGAADVLLAPYLRDRRTDFLMVPQKLAEYMACGRPIVVSDVGEIRRVMIDSETGLLSKPGNPEDIADKIQSVLNNPQLANR